MGIDVLTLDENRMIAEVYRSILYAQVRPNESNLDISSFSRITVLNIQPKQPKSFSE